MGFSLSCACLLAVGGGAVFAGDAGAPAAESHPVTDTVHGVTVTDPYRWLEKSSDPKVVAWSAAQDKRTRQYLDAIPQRAAIYKRLFQDISAASSSYYGFVAVGDHVFANYYQPPKQQSMIAVLGNALDPASARVIVDPNAINPKGTTAIDWFVPSHDGKILAVSMSENGSEDGTLHLFDVASGKEIGPRIPSVQFPTAGGSLAWTADSKGFWYTRYRVRSAPPRTDIFFSRYIFIASATIRRMTPMWWARIFPKSEKSNSALTTILICWWCQWKTVMAANMRTT
jgi:prolyl oligopeptidase